MSTNEPPTTSRRKMMPGVVAIAVIFLCAAMAAVGFAIGRATSAPEPESTLVAVEELPEATESVAAAPSQTTETTEETVEQGEVVEDPAETDETTEASSEPMAAPDTPSASTAPSQQETPRIEDVDDIDLATFYEVWDVIESDFDGELPSNEDILQALIHGSIDALDDDFTRYIEPDVAARLREDMGGSVSGIGAFVRENDDGFVEIVSPIEGQPADLAGLLPGDILVEVDGEPVLGLSFDEVILLVRGPEGTAVVLTVARQDEEEFLEFEIVRSRFDIPVVEAEMLPDNIAYIQLTEFNRNAAEKLEEALLEMLVQNPQGLVFDLRNNPGGFLDQSIAVADMFLPQSVVLFERNANGLDRTFNAGDGDVAETIPMVVLINAGSASASEIVAGAVQDHERAILVGETSFGKGSVQNVHQLSDGSELRVTIARWYTPANHSIDKEGIAPDIEVEMDVSVELGSEEDTQLQRAVEYLLTGQ